MFLVQVYDCGFPVCGVVGFGFRFLYFGGIVSGLCGGYWLLGLDFRGLLSGFGVLGVGGCFGFGLRWFGVV